MPKRLKRSPTLAVYWEKEKLVCEDFYGQLRREISPGVIKLLNAFNSFMRIEDVLENENLPFDMDEAKALIERYHKLGILIEEGSGDAARKEAANSWHWGAPARFYHFGTRDAMMPLEKAARKTYAESLFKEPQPPIYKTYPRTPRIPFPPVQIPERSLREVLGKRRSVREFSDKPLSLRQFAILLYAVWGEQGKIEAPPFGELLKKTSPSGGARHPIEVYPIVSNIEGVNPGVYHYNVKDHSLELLHQGPERSEILSISSKQEWASQAPVCFLMSAVFGRTMWKYRHAKGLQTIYLDCGHLSMSLYLVATALDLGVCFTDAISHSRADKLIGLDGIQEAVISLSAVGFPKGASPA